MADESTQFILGDAAADALSEGRRGFFKRRRKRKNEEPRLTHCENCEAPLTGEYCAKCGQHAIDYRRSFWTVLVDAADSFLNWDTKFLNSVGILLFKPWKLTNDFNAGRRARYVHPLRFYLLASIAFFLMLRAVHLQTGGPLELTKQDRKDVAASLEEIIGPDSALSPEARARLEALRTKLTQSEGALTDEEVGEIKATIGDVVKSAIQEKWNRKDRGKLRKALKQLPGTGALPADDAETPPTETSPVAEEGQNRSASPKPETPPGIHFNVGPNEPNNDPGTHVTFGQKGKLETPFESWMQQRVKDKVGEDGTKAQLFLETLRSNIPTMMLFCVPLFALILKILYIFQRRYYIEHLVYALHIHTFAYMATVVITLIGVGALRVIPSFQPLLVVLLSLAAAAQVFISIRRVYGQGWFFSAFKFFLGGVAYLIILGIGVGATAFVTLLLPN